MMIKTGIFTILKTLQQIYIAVFLLQGLQFVPKKTNSGLEIELISHYIGFQQDLN